MGAGRIWKSVEKTFFYTAFTTIFLVIMPGIPPYVSFRSFKISPQMKLVGPLRPNGHLDRATVLVEGEFIGPESIVVVNNTLFTGVGDGRVVRIDETSKGPRVSTVAHFGKPCVPHQYQDCVLPLGVRMDGAGDLIFADAYKGILKVNPKTGSVEQYFSISDPIDGFPLKFADDLDIGKDGSVYFSSVANMWIHEYMDGYNFADTSGRLIKYDPKTKKNTVLLKDLACANGVQLSPNEDYVLVAETTKGRVIRYYLQGPKAGTSDVFIDGLPGMPDNIRSDGKGGYYIALPMGHSPALLSLGPLPQLRKLLFRMHWIITTALELIDSARIFSGAYLNQLKAYFDNLCGNGFQDVPAIIVNVDGNGRVIGSLHVQNLKNEIKAISQFILGEKYAYMGSYSGDKIWKVLVSDLPGREK